MEKNPAMERFNTILEEMNGMVLNSRKAFLNSNACIVDRERLCQLMQDLQDSLPAELDQAKKIIKERTSILSKASSEANEKVQQASVSARRMTDEAAQKAQMTTSAAEYSAQETFRKSNEEAQGRVEAAKQEALRIVEEANQHAAALVSQEEVTARAQVEADELRQRTQEEMANLRHEVFNYLDGVLGEIDRTLVEKTNHLRMTRQDLNTRR